MSMSSKSTAFEENSRCWYSSYTSATVWSKNEATRSLYIAGDTSSFFAFEIAACTPRGTKRFGSRSRSSRHCLTSRTWSAWS